MPVIYTATVVPPSTRTEVRELLAKGLNDLLGGEAQRNIADEFSDLATGSDREVIESYRRFDKSHNSRGLTDAKYARSAIGLQIRDLFGKALQRMKELPPDPPESPQAIPPADSNSVTELNKPA